MKLYQGLLVYDSTWWYCASGYASFGGGASGSWSDVATSSDFNFTNQDFGLLGNYFRDVIVFLFKPSDTSLDRFSDLKDDLADRIPFSYYYGLRNLIASSSIPVASSSLTFDFSSFGGPSAVSLISFDSITTFTSAMETMFNVICWIFLAIYFIWRIPTILQK